MAKSFLTFGVDQASFWANERVTNQLSVFKMSWVRSLFGLSYSLFLEATMFRAKIAAHAFFSRKNSLLCDRERAPGIDFGLRIAPFVQARAIRCEASSALKSRGRLGNAECQKIWRVTCASDMKLFAKFLNVFVVGTLPSSVFFWTVSIYGPWDSLEIFLGDEHFKLLIFSPSAGWILLAASYASNFSWAMVMRNLNHAITRCLDKELWVEARNKLLVLRTPWKKAAQEFLCIVIATLKQTNHTYKNLLYTIIVSTETVELLASGKYSFLNSQWKQD